MHIVNSGQNLIGWFLSHGVKIIGILIVAWLVGRLSKILISRLIKTTTRVKSKLAGDKKLFREREKTLKRFFSSSLRFVIWLIAILTILPELGINIGPLLAGVGVIGLAISMGARTLIQDYLSGLFILLEDQYRVGEEINIAGIKGKVIDLSLRRTILRDPEGKIYYIPNNQAKVVINFSRTKK